MLRPSVLTKLALPASNLLPASLVFRPRSRRDPQLCHPKRYAPSREKPLLLPARTQNYDESTVQLNPMLSAPLLLACARRRRDTLQIRALRLIRAYRSVPLPVRYPRPWSLGKKRSPRSAIRKGTYRTDTQRRADQPLRRETLLIPNARSQHHAPRILSQIRNCPRNKKCRPRRRRPQPLIQGRSGLAQVCKYASLSASLRSNCRS